MKKTLIALAVLGATAGVAHAQSNVTVYGIVDTGFVKASGSKVLMQENINNRLGFRGVEDLGGGLKATFELEQRFDLFNGRARSGDEAIPGANRAFDGASNVGLAGNWGAVRFGRMNEISTETLRQFDPFQQYGVAGMFQSVLRLPRISNSTRYDSPNLAGFNVKASYTLKTDGNGAELDPLGFGGTANDGYGVAVGYNNGPIAAVANYNKAPNSSDSTNWNVAGAYAFGPAKIMANYERTKDKVADDVQKNWLVGATYKVGAGEIKASYAHQKFENADSTDKQFGLGYTHNLSKRTSLYAIYARLTPDAGDNTNSYQLGMTHKF